MLTPRDTLRFALRLRPNDQCALLAQMVEGNTPTGHVHSDLHVLLDRLLHLQPEHAPTFERIVARMVRSAEDIDSQTRQRTR